jgi:hypothetical protein
MLLVQEYLRTHSLAQLKVEHAVNARIHGYKFSLNYDQIECDNSNPLASQCRGLVLAPVGVDQNHTVDPEKVVGDTLVLSRPMDRFFNHGQIEAAPVNFEAHGTRFFEKLDGTMCALYWDQVANEWHVATRSVPEADLPIDGFDEKFTFRSLFEKAIEETAGSPFNDWLTYANLSAEITYVFELCTPANRVVVEQTAYKVWLIALRRSHTGEEFDIETPDGQVFVPVCPSYQLSSLKDMMDFVSDRDPTQYEGIVAVDAAYRRVKVKNAGYLAMSRAKDSAMRSPRALVELCLLGRLDDALPLLPDHICTRAYEIQAALRTFLINSERLYQDCLAAATSEDPHTKRKQMALEVTARGAWMPYMMQRYSGKVSSFEEFMKQHITPSTGEYSKTFLDSLLREIERKH